MVRFFFFLCFIQCTFGDILLSQDLNLSFHHLTPNEGLSQGTNAYIYRDSYGFVWLSSTNGLNRFEGVSTKVYTPNPNDTLQMLGRQVTSPIFEDKSHNLWFTTNEAINCYVRATDRIKHFRLKNETGQRLTKDYYAFYLDTINNQLWLRVGFGKETTSGGQLHLFDIEKEEGQISPYDLNGQRCSVVLDRLGKVKKIVSSMLITSSGFEITDLENEGKKSYYSLDDLYKNDSNPVYTYNVHVEEDSILWIASRGGLLKFDLEKNKIAKHFRPINERGEYLGDFWSVIPYKNNQLFIGTTRGGLLLFDKKREDGNLIQQFKQEENSNYSLHTNMLRELYLDQENNLWVSSYSNNLGFGVAYANLDKVKFSTVAYTQNQPIYTVFENKMDSSILVSMDAELLVYLDGKNVSSISTYKYLDGFNNYKESNLFSHFNTFFRDKQQRQWGIINQSLFELDTVTLQPEYKKQLNSFVKSAYTLKNGTSLLVFSDSISIFEKDSIQPFEALGKYHKNYFYTNIFEDEQERLYLAENATNLFIFSKHRDHYQLEKTIENIGYCHYFYDDVEKEKLWVATSNALMEINTRTLQYQLIDLEASDLSDAIFYSVIPDDNGRLWLSSNHGLIRYEPASEPPSIHRYTIVDGLQGNEFVPQVALKSQSGGILMGGVNGLNVFHPNSVKSVSYLPQVQFTNFIINDQPLSHFEKEGLDTIIVENLKSLNLPYNKNTLSFSFAALEFSDAAKNRYQYQLLGNGYSDNWIDNDTRNFVRFANLQAGKYQFKVKAANSDGEWNHKKIKLLDITIRPPWWQTWWFYLLCTLAISTILYAIFQYRLQQALKIERMRVKISSDLHDDVGTLLSGLAMQTEILELTAPEKDKPRLIRVGELARSAMSRMRDTVWAIDARKDKLENLLDRMREHAEETLAPRDILFDLEVKQLDLKKNLPTDVRQNLYLIYKEAITNIAKHSNATKVQVVLQKVGAAFEMRIEDNGQIVQKNYKTTGAGLMNMKMRAEQIEATLEFYQKEGFGILLRRKRNTTL